MAWGRLALIHAAGEPDKTLEKMAELWGYEYIEPQKTSAEDKNKPPKGESKTNLSEKEQNEEQPCRPPALFILVSKLESLATTSPSQPDYLTNPSFNFNQQPAATGSYCFPAAKPLLSMARLIPLLHNGLGQNRKGNNLDMARLSSQLAQGKALHRLPYLPRLVWSQSLQIIVDARLDLEPYWVDFIFIVEELKKLLGAEAVAAIRFDEDTLTKELAYCLPYPTKSADSWQVWQVPADDVAVLVLSDLKARHWSSLLKRLGQRSAPILTLSPSATAPTDLTLCQLAKPNPLNDKHPLPRYPYQKGFKSLPTVTDERMREIFALLSVLPLIDAALLRRLRLELNWGGSELEYFVWQHPEVRNNGLGIYFPKDSAETYRPYYPKDSAEKFWQIVNQHHAKAFHGLKCLEGLNQYAKEQKTSIDIKTYFQQLCATLHQTSEHSPRYSALQAQAKTVIALVSKDIFDTELNDTIHHISAFAYAEEISAENWQPLLSLGLECKKLLWKLSAEQRQFRNWFIAQQGQGQFVCIKSDTLPLLNIVTVSGMLPPVYIENSKELVLEQHSVTLAENETVLIKTDLQVLELKAIKKPGWALSIGRDAQGLFVTVPWINEPRLYWEISTQNYQSVKKGKSVNVLLAEDNKINQQIFYEILTSMDLKVTVVNNGKEAVEKVQQQHFALVLMDIFMPEMNGYEATMLIRKQIDNLSLPIVAVTAMSGEREKCLSVGMNDYLPKPVDIDSLHRVLSKYLPKKHDKVGVDEYGLYVDLSIENITQRLRWIEPGTFLMGSPETEAERMDWEIQHQVTLTEGFWLADTACTQALWQVVMSENPAYFKDDLNNPVENVSWNDAQQFINRLNNLLPDLQAKLPSEAQWEYACRAGTTTPFSFGDNITPEQVNYHGNHPYNKAEKALYRGRTVPVKFLPANAWGLYEMHGNVWEWCEDFYTDYPDKPVIDPVNDTEGSVRLMRGGSWYNFGRYARSAYRLWRDAVDRGDALGFRFALGIQVKS